MRRVICSAPLLAERSAPSRIWVSLVLWSQTMTGEATNYG